MTWQGDDLTDQRAACAGRISMTAQITSPYYNGQEDGDRNNDSNTGDSIEEFHSCLPAQ
jgi:hypothetical protein